jgi:hypothetical protein
MRNLLRLIFPFLTCVLAQQASAARLIIPGPTGSGSFGEDVKVLPNRNIVVMDSGFDDTETGSTDVGAAYLYSPEGQLISTLKGSTSGDQVGRDVFVLSNGNYLITSTLWSASRGAVSFCSAATGCEGVVSAANSLVGAQADDLVGSPVYVKTLSNGNYLVAVPAWDNGAVANAGAVTWGSGTSGVSGVVSGANSLIGTTANDNLGNAQLVALSNGNYVVVSPNWDDSLSSPAIANRGAITFGNGSTGTVGTISASNSFLPGVNAAATVVALSNGNYVIGMPNWRNALNIAVGAVTWASGVTGIIGTPSESNSLVGSNAGDAVGLAVTPLPTGNYVVQSDSWSSSRGALTFGSGINGVTGTVSVSNSLVGATAGDRIGQLVTILSDGDFVASSSNWRNGGLSNAGAVTWGSGTTGITGTVSASNSLIGSNAVDLLGRERTITALTNGNYVVVCNSCDVNGIVDNASATWASGDGGMVGALTAANSLLAGFSSLGSNIRAFPLSNGNYVVSNLTWGSGGLQGLGAVTFAPGNTGLVGVVSAANSLVGSQANDGIGTAVVPLTNGNYVVLSQSWANSTFRNAGAATFASGVTGVVGAVSTSNSLVGSAQDDRVGKSAIALTTGDYVVVSDSWNNATALRAGASTWASGTTGIVGTINASNSFVGTRTDDRVGLYANNASGFGPGAIALPDGNYLLRSLYWDGPVQSGVFGNVSAVTFGLAGGLAPNQIGVVNLADLVGRLNENNSAFGTAFRGAQPTIIPHDYNPSPTPQLRQLVLGLPLENRVMLLSYDLVFRGDFE